MDTRDTIGLFGALDQASRRLWLERHPKFDPAHPEKWWRRFKGGVVCPEGHFHETGRPRLVETRGVRMKTKLMTGDQVEAVHAAGAPYAYADTPRGEVELYFDGEKDKVWVLTVTKIRTGRRLAWLEKKG